MATEIKPDTKSEGRHDPFVPKTPAIPGVPADDPNRRKSALPAPVSTAASAPHNVSPKDDDSKQRTIAIAACAGAFVILALFLIIPRLTRSSKPADVPAQTDAATPTAADTELSAAKALTDSGPIAPGVIATTEELAKPWSSKRFTFRDSLTGRTTPALVVHLPNGSYWGFATTEPYGTCQLEFITDLSKLRADYSYAANHPMVVDPCQHAVFDLLQYGGASNAEVRGALVQGMGVRPPLAIEIVEHGKEISALRME
jgi:hypothetical protein